MLTDGRTDKDGRTDTGMTGILLAHSGELKNKKNILEQSRGKRYVKRTVA